MYKVDALKELVCVTFYPEGFLPDVYYIKYCEHK